MAISGSVETSAYTRGDGKTRTVVFNWTAIQSTKWNSSEISWVLKGGGTATGEAWVQVSELEIVLDGSQIYHRDSSTHTNCYYDTVLASGKFTLNHNSDGSRSFKIHVGAGIYNWEINKTGETTFTLDPIPRASEIGATDANIGSNSSVVIAKKASSYTHSIKYEFGSLSGYITSSGGTSSSESKFSATSVSFAVPTNFYAQIPNTKTGKCKLTCTTYSGSTKIGDAKTAEFTVTAAESLCKPDVSGTVVDSNDTTKNLTGDESKLIKYYSNALCTINGTAKNNATVITKKIGGTTVSGTTSTINAVESGSIVFSVTDSRGYSASVTVNAILIAYVKLTVNAQLNRVDPTSGDAKLIIKGNYFNNSFGAVSNTLKIQYRIAQSGEPYGDWIQISPVLSGNSYSITIGLSGLDYQHSYSAEILCEDKLMSKTVAATVSQGIPVFDWGENDFVFHVPVSFQAGVAGNALFDMIYPVGSIYMSVNSTSPAALFGGTWERIQDRFLLAAGTDYSAGATGGEATHALTESEMPAHTHKRSDNTTLGLYGVDGAVSRNWIAAGSNYVAFSASKKDGIGYGGSVASTGSGDAHNNMPPYLAVYVWKRTE